MSELRWCALSGFRRAHALRMTPAGYERSYCGQAPAPGEHWALAGDLPRCRSCIRMIQSGGSPGSVHI